MIPNSVNFLDLCYPGVYEIYCHRNQTSYFGQSENILYRLGRHFNDLLSTSHQVENLQNDWNLYGREGFLFRPVVSGPDWTDEAKRIAKETECITHCSHAVYNRLPSQSSQNVRKQWTYQGITYSSGAEAARELQVSPSTIYRRLKKEGDVVVIPVAKPVSIDGQVFSSLTEALAQLGISRSTLYRKLRDPNYPTWFFSEETRSNDYPGRE